MRKAEVLQGALALNGEDKKYTVSTEGDKIIIEAKYSANIAHTREGTFRLIAHLNDDNTYVETHSVHDGRHSSFGKSIKIKKSISFSFGSGDDTIDIEKEDFSSEYIKKVLRDYLEACGYKKTNKGFFKKLFGK